MAHQETKKGERGIGECPLESSRFQHSVRLLTNLSFPFLHKAEPEEFVLAHEEPPRLFLFLVLDDDATIVFRTFSSTPPEAANAHRPLIFQGSSRSKIQAHQAPPHSHS